MCGGCGVWVCVCGWVCGCGCVGVGVWVCGCDMTNFSKKQGVGEPMLLRGHSNVSYASCVFLGSDLASPEAHSPNPQAKGLPCPKSIKCC